LTEEEIVASIETIREKYLGEEFSFELVDISEGYQFLTKKDYFPTVNALIQHKAKKRLSVAQMETLSIIAYKQPISKPEIERLRGVNCDYAIQKLLEKELIAISGKSDSAGRPILYSTSDDFMDYFGIKSVKDLPQLKDIQIENNEIGTPVESMEAETVMHDEEISAEGELMQDEAAVETEVVAHEVTLEAETSSELVDESELPVPDRKQIYMENLENDSEVSDRDAVERRND
jgi:segregation and condensation protein B